MGSLKERLAFSIGRVEQERLSDNRKAVRSTFPQVKKIDEKWKAWWYRYLLDTFDAAINHA
jgi:hypothetical protein